MFMKKMSRWYGASVYDDRNYDTVYFNEELAHDFALGIGGFNGAKISKWVCSSLSVRQVLIMTEQFML